MIERNAKSQLTLISDMLDMARISSGKVRLELADVNMTQVVAGAIDAVRPAADAKNIRLVADLPPGMAPVSGDADRLLQVTWNILTNAVKFTGEGGMVVVSLRSDRAGTHLTVADTGQGIDPKFLSQVFERFKQADTSAGTDAPAASGSASPWSRTWSACTAGKSGREPRRRTRIDLLDPPAEPQRGIGSRGGAAGAEGQHRPRLTASASWSSKTIRMRARSRSARSPMPAASTIGVGNATEALAAIAVERRQDRRAWSATSACPAPTATRCSTRCAALPLMRGAMPAIAVTAYASAADAQRALERGFAAHITKPYTPSVLIAAIRNALDSRT